MSHTKKQTEKVIYVITSLENGGAEAFLYSLVKQIGNKNVLIISLKYDWGYGKRFEALGCEVMTLGMKAVRPNIGHFVKLVKIFRKNKSATIFTWMHHANLFAGLAAKFASCKNIIWGIHDAYMHPEREKLASRIVIRVGAIFSYLIPRKIIYVAKKAAEVHESIYYDKTKTAVIPNGYDVQRFKPNRLKRSTVREQLNIADDVFLIGMIARFDPLKDHATFIKVAKTLIESDKYVHFLLCGSGISNDNQQLQKLINQAKIKKHITLAKTRDDIESLYAALDVFLLTSLTEAFPNVLCEAMACEVPCISTDVGDAAVIVDKLGAIVPVRDDKQIAIEIEAMTVKPVETWKILKSNARKHIVSNFSIEHIAQKYVDIAS